jgi:hypothetical protein
MGLVSFSRPEPASGLQPAAGAQGNGDGRSFGEGLDGPHKGLSVFLKELRQETQKIREQAGTVHGSASKLAAALEKLLDQERPG